MNIELSGNQVDIIKNCLADAMEEIRMCIDKQYKKGRKDYVRMLDQEYKDYKEVYEKF